MDGRDAMEAEARVITWRDYLRRDHGRLFSLDDFPIQGSEEWNWRALEDMYQWRAIGVVPKLDDLYTRGDWKVDILVGVFRGCHRGWFGSVDFEVMHFGHAGITTHRSPLNLEWICVLPDFFQRYTEKFLERIYFTGDSYDPDQLR